MTEASASDVFLVFGKELAARPAVVNKLLQLSMDYKVSLSSLQASWSEHADKENLTPSLVDLQTLESTLIK